MSAYSQEAVISMSVDMISSTFGLTFLISSYTHLALLMRFTLVNQMTLVGVGMWVVPVKTFRPYFGVLTMSGLSPLGPAARSSSLDGAGVWMSSPSAAGSRFGWNGSSATHPLKPGPVSSEPWKSAAL